VQMVDDAIARLGGLDALVYAAGCYRLVTVADASPGDWQQAFALVIVACTAAVFLWTKFRPRKFDFARDTHCGCSASGQSGPKTTVTFRARKGERSRIVVKMS